MKHKGFKLALSKKVGKATTDYGMLEEGDRILVGVSGGKDSLSLFHILSSRQAFCPVKYQLIAVHVDFGRFAKNTKKLETYFKKCGWEYIIKRRKLPSKKRKGEGKGSCFWCSWNRRKVLFDTAVELGCNKIALGHHLDDIVQTVLLNLFFSSQISAMAPNQELFEGKLAIIRPFAYVQEKEIIRFAREMKIPTSSCNCPNSPDANRKMVARMIRDLEKVCPNIRTNIFRSLKRIRKDYLL